MQRKHLQRKIKLPVPKISVMRSERHYSLANLLVFAAVFATIGGYFIWRSLAAAPLLSSIEAEQMNIPSAAIIYSDSTASGGKAVRFNGNGSITGSVTIPPGSTAASLSVVAHGNNCHGWAALSLSVDGSIVLPPTAMSSSSWTSYNANLTLPSGTHSISLTGTNIAPHNSCSRNLYVDVVQLYGAVVAAAPTVSLSTSPSNVASGSASTLTWSSTNATSCNASGAWSGSQPTSGSASTGPLASASTYTLVCTGSGGSATASATVTLSPSTSPFNDNFSTDTQNSCFGDGVVFGNWISVYAGYGCNKVISSGGATWLSEFPAVSTTSTETHAALVTGPPFTGSFTYNVTEKTISQNRVGSTPNTWEVGWVLWDYTDDSHFYSLVLKPNGWELGKEDPAYAGNQRFLTTGSSPTFPIGSTNQVVIKQNNNTFTVMVNGSQLTSFTDTQSPYTSGKIGLYDEDSNALFTNVSVTTP